jgi:hypothetical protein
MARWLQLLLSGDGRLGGECEEGGVEADPDAMVQVVADLSWSVVVGWAKADEKKVLVA